jgi:uncharacterized protein (TIGR00255 family)
MLSMTGYGVAGANLGTANVVMEARSFNHRFLDVRIRLPGVLQDHVAMVDEIARKQLVRGRVEISGRLEGRLSGRVVLDRTRARAAMQELGDLSREFGAQTEVPLTLLALVPGLFIEDTGVDAEAILAATRSAALAACAALLAMRRAEGLVLAQDLQTRLAKVRALTGELDQRSAEWTESYRERLRTRLGNLLTDKNIMLDAGRLEHELAVLAERADVSEEVTRLVSHCEQFASALLPGDEPTGRRLEFLLQEMAREANTLGAKSADVRMTACMVELKTELERMREQVQNVM